MHEREHQRLRHPVQRGVKHRFKERPGALAVHGKDRVQHGNGTNGLQADATEVGCRV